MATGLHCSGLAELAPSLETLRTAIREQRRLSMLYHGSSQLVDTRRQVDPYALLHR